MSLPVAITASISLNFSSTKIIFSLPRISNVKLTVYNVLGQEVAVLVNGKRNAGSYEYQFNAIDLPSGLYFYLLQSDGYSQVNKMILI